MLWIPNSESTGREIAAAIQRRPPLHGPEELAECNPCTPDHNDAECGWEAEKKTEGDRF